MQLQIHKLHVLASTWHIQPTFKKFFIATSLRNLKRKEKIYFHCSFMCGLKRVLAPFHPFNDLFLIIGGLHLLRGISLHSCCFAHDHWDCYIHRALLPICENSLVKSFNIFLLLCVNFSSSSKGVYMCDQFSHLKPFLCHPTGPLAAYALCCNRSHRLHSGE